MKRVFQHFSRKHLYVFLEFYIVFAGITLLVLSRQSACDWRENWNVAATVGSLLGPFTGTVARHFQPCCWRFSVGLFPFCGAFLLGGFVFQCAPLPWPSVERSLRRAGWFIGLLGWFGGALVSFGHALS